MSSKLRTGGLVVAIPTALLVVSSWEIVECLRVDTRRETAAQIRPGMTRDEVARIVGAPDGDYRVWAQPKTFTLISGSRWPTVFTWESYHGRIEVVDGVHGFGPDPATGELRSLNTSRGVVDSVRWSPVPEEERGWHPAAAIGCWAAVYFGVAFALYRVVVHRQSPG
jgi:hypothetical protein